MEKDETCTLKQRDGKVQFRRKKGLHMTGNLVIMFQTMFSAVWQFTWVAALCLKCKRIKLEGKK